MNIQGLGVCNKTKMSTILVTDLKGKQVTTSEWKIEMKCQWEFTEVGMCICGSLGWGLPLMGKRRELIGTDRWPLTNSNRSVWTVPSIYTCVRRLTWDSRQFHLKVRLSIDTYGVTNWVIELRSIWELFINRYIPSNFMYNKKFHIQEFTGCRVIPVNLVIVVGVLENTTDVLFDYYILCVYTCVCISFIVNQLWLIRGRR